MKKIIIFILIGVILVAGVAVTGTYGLTEENIKIYKKAISLEDNGDFGFEGFKLTDYPVAFYDGNNDYVISWKNGEYIIKKRSAVINSIVATASPINGYYEVLTPAIEKMSSLVNFMAVGNASYGEDEHIATLWHEGFHCWQFTNYYSNIKSICTVPVDESAVAQNADANEKAVSLFEQQAQLLENAVNTDDVDNIRKHIIKYKKLDDERKTLLSDEVNELENYYTIVEGTACYIEAGVHKILLPDSFKTNYIDTISDYAGGSSKYYKTGMAMCMILDRLNPQWKNGYDFSEPLIDLIYKELEI